MSGTTCSLAELRAFFGRFATFQAGRQAQRISTFKERFATIRSGVRAIRALAQETDRRTGRKFNIFQVLSVQAKEVRTHSALLAELLNPEGSHAQGNLFLRKFLAMLADPARKSVHGATRFPKIEMTFDARWMITREMNSEEVRFDLILKGPQAVVVIENKIYAREQEDQLDRYSRWLEKHCRTGHARALVYLTLDGTQSRRAKCEYFTLSYRPEVQRWLEDCARELESQRLADLLKQYVDTLNSL